MKFLVGIMINMQHHSCEEIFASSWQPFAISQAACLERLWIVLEDIQDLLRPAIFDPTSKSQAKQSYISKLSEEIEAQGGKPKEKKNDVFQVKLELLRKFKLDWASLFK